jgi:DNA-binding Lrp family transcriptional regulator
MAKRSKTQVEKDEKKVIMELQSHAKESIDTLAKRCSFSGPKIRRIIKNLEENKTIWGYHAVTDYEKLDLREYILLIKKTNKPLDETAEKIITREIEVNAEKLDIMIGSSFYLHGLYDWVICFTAMDLRQAKKFEGEFIKTFKDIISETQLLENIFPVKRSGIINPDIKKIKDFL